MNNLLENIDKLHTTELGMERIKKNLRLETSDVVSWCKKQILDKDAKIERRGKNWYAVSNGCRITIHARAYTIITAHRVKERCGSEGDLKEEV